MAPEFDLAIIGGGINGCGIARDAAGRGHKVYLCEMGDLASATSSWSTKLIHGGLRYLEYYEFRLVREALMEREVLWAIAPHIIHPQRFVLPHHAGLRPWWLLRLGLFLYDHLGGRKLLPPTASVDLRSGPLAAPLARDRFAKGFEYSDCTVDDARLVVLNARDAANRGAMIETRTKARSARQVSGQWEIEVENTRTGAVRVIRARTLVNAAGPWVQEVLTRRAGIAARCKVRLVQGSHIVIRRRADHDRAYLFQNGDGRVVFAIPYQDDFTLIGTTDHDYAGDPAAATATPAEVGYLCAAASEYFAAPVTPADAVWSYSGVRPLYDDGAGAAKAATRDYVFELDTDAAPVLSIFGGKITTYRRLAEAALDRLAPYLGGVSGEAKGWTGRAALPGGDFAVTGLPALIDGLRARYAFLTPAHVRRLARSYGTRTRALLGDAATLADLGQSFGATLTETEVRYLMTEEWADTPADVLWRRTMLGLHLHGHELEQLGAWMSAHRQQAAQQVT